ncbi:MAG TPA: hypothetical protein VFN82_08280 [Solirubrobacterales bacterium]|nr:hypothetical protein [Solirubrobacterales bacterium]
MTVERELPSCPETRATFVARPGEVPPFVKPQAFAVQNANTGRLARRPRQIVLGKHGSFSLCGLRWRSFGGARAYASGTASIRRGGRRWNPRASVRLSFRIPEGPDRLIYSVLRYVLHGPVPRGLDRRGFQFFG